MNRIAYMVIKNLPAAPVWFYRVCRLGRDQDPHTEQERYDYLRKLVKRVNKSGRVAIEVHGRDNSYCRGRLYHVPESPGPL